MQFWQLMMLWLCSPLIVLAIKNIDFADQIRFFDINWCFHNRHLCIAGLKYSFHLIWVIYDLIVNTLHNSKTL